MEATTQFVFTRYVKEVILQLKGVEDTGVDTEGYRGRTLLDTSDCEGRTGSTLCDLSNAEVATKSGELDLLPHDLHLLLQFAGKLCPHRILCHTLNLSYCIQI